MNSNSSFTDTPNAGVPNSNTVSSNNVPPLPPTNHIGGEKKGRFKVTNIPSTTHNTEDSSSEVKCVSISSAESIKTGDSTVVIEKKDEKLSIDDVANSYSTSKSIDIPEIILTDVKKIEKSSTNDDNDNKGGVNTNGHSSSPSNEDTPSVMPKKTRFTVKKIPREDSVNPSEVPTLRENDSPPSQIIAHNNHNIILYQQQPAVGVNIMSNEYASYLNSNSNNNHGNNYFRDQNQLAAQLQSMLDLNMQVLQALLGQSQSNARNMENNFEASLNLPRLLSHISSNANAHHLSATTALVSTQSHAPHGGGVTSYTPGEIPTVSHANPVPVMSNINTSNTSSSATATQINPPGNDISPIPTLSSNNPTSGDANKDVSSGKENTSNINTSNVQNIHPNTEKDSAKVPSPSTTQPSSSTSQSNSGTSSSNVTSTVSNSNLEKDKSFVKISNHMNEMKRELETLQKQKRDSSLESQRLREKCQQLEDRLASEQSRNSALEEKLEKAKEVQKSLLAQINSQAAKIESQLNTIESQSAALRAVNNSSQHLQRQSPSSQDAEGVVSSVIDHINDNVTSSTKDKDPKDSLVTILSVDNSLNNSIHGLPTSLAGGSASLQSTASISLAVTANSKPPLPPANRDRDQSNNNIPNSTSANPASAVLGNTSSSLLIGVNNSGNPSHLVGNSPTNATSSNPAMMSGITGMHTTIPSMPIHHQHQHQQAPLISLSQASPISKYPISSPLLGVQNTILPIGQPQYHSVQQLPIINNVYSSNDNFIATSPGTNLGSVNNNHPSSVPYLQTGQPNNVSVSAGISNGIDSSAGGIAYLHTAPTSSASSSILAKDFSDLVPLMNVLVNNVPSSVSGSFPHVPVAPSPLLAPSPGTGHGHSRSVFGNINNGHTSSAPDDMKNMPMLVRSNSLPNHGITGSSGVGGLQQVQYQSIGHGNLSSQVSPLPAAQHGPMSSGGVSLSASSWNNPLLSLVPQYPPIPTSLNNRDDFDLASRDPDKMEPFQRSK